MALSPRRDGALQLTRRLVPPATVSLGAAGAPGRPVGVPLPESEYGPSPAALPARTCTS